MLKFVKLLISVFYNIYKLIKSEQMKDRKSKTHSDSVDEIHVGFNGQCGILDLHQFSEDHRQLHHLAEVDVDVFDPVRQRCVQQDQVF